VNEWRVRSSSYVGTIVTPDVRVLITPKVPIGNLFHMLEASGKPLDVTQAVFEYGRTRDLVASFATFYARHLERALTGGVPHAYRELQDRLPGIRGRVDFPAQRRLAGLTLPAECRFDEYTADVQLNRILRGAADRLWRLPGVAVPTRQALQRLAAELGECAPVRAEDLRTQVIFTREFVTARLTRYLIGHLAVDAQRTLHLDTGSQVRTRPDLIFERERAKPAYVADIKYKITADGYGREADYYQILAYATALGVPEGMLIYCQDDGTTPSRETQVRILGTRLRTWPVDLSGTPAQIEREMRRLADEVRARTFPSGPQGS
jgi:5-methylcytosine-specific restriction enzyme subunit McrC